MINQSLYMPIMSDEVTLVKVHFHNHERGVEGAKLYTYKTRFMLVVDDIVIVEARQWYSVAKVIEVSVPLPFGDTDEANEHYRWVIAPVSHYIADHAYGTAKREQEIIDRVNRARAERMRLELREALGLGVADLSKLVHGDNDDILHEQEEDKQ